MVLLGKAVVAVCRGTWHGSKMISRAGAPSGNWSLGSGSLALFTSNSDDMLYSRLGTSALLFP